MAIEVFLSGVTKEFRDRRRLLADRLQSMTSLRIDVRYQENLAASASSNATLVAELISNVHRCQAAVCWVGNEPGYPTQLDARLQIQSLAEGILNNQYRLSSHGQLWEAWTQLGHGMTYTQLEVFLCISAFPDQIRSLILRANWQNAEVLRDSVECDWYRSYHEFLQQHQEATKWGVLENDLSQPIAYCADLAALQRDLDSGQLEFGLEPQEALSRGITILESRFERKELLAEHWDSFYEDVVVPRLFQPVAVLQGELPLPRINSDVAAVMVAAAGGDLHLILQGADWVQVTIMNALATQLKQQWRFGDLGSEFRIQGYDPSSCWLLLWSQDAGYSLQRHEGTEINTVSVPDIPQARPDAFSSQFAVVGQIAGAPWFAVPQGARWQKVQQHGQAWTVNELDALDTPVSLWAVPIKRSPFQVSPEAQVSSETEPIVVEVGMRHEWAQLSERASVEFRAEETFLMPHVRVFHRAAVGSLFLMSEPNLEIEGVVEKVELDVEGCLRVHCPFGEPVTVAQLPITVDVAEVAVPSLSFAEIPALSHLAYVWLADQQILLLIETRREQSNREPKPKAFPFVFYLPKPMVAPDQRDVLDRMRKHLDALEKPARIMEA